MLRTWLVSLKRPRSKPRKNCDNINNRIFKDIIWVPFICLSFLLFSSVIYTILMVILISVDSKSYCSTTCTVSNITETRSLEQLLGVTYYSCNSEFTSCLAVATALNLQVHQSQPCWYKVENLPNCPQFGRAPFPAVWELGGLIVSVVVMLFVGPTLYTISKTNGSWLFHFTRHPPV